MIFCITKVYSQNPLIQPITYEQFKKKIEPFLDPPKAVKQSSYDKVENEEDDNELTFYQSSNDNARTQDFVCFEIDLLQHDFMYIAGPITKNAWLMYMPGFTDHDRDIYTTDCTHLYTYYQMDKIMTSKQKARKGNYEIPLNFFLNPNNFERPTPLEIFLKN